LRAKFGERVAGRVAGHLTSLFQLSFLTKLVDGHAKVGTVDGHIADARLRSYVDVILHVHLAVRYVDGGSRIDLGLVVAVGAQDLSNALGTVGDGGVCID